MSPGLCPCLPAGCGGWWAPLCLAGAVRMGRLAHREGRGGRALPAPRHGHVAPGALTG